MGLDIYFITDKEKADKKAGEKHEIAYFRKFNALYAWIDRHIGEVENCEELLLTKDHFEQLQSTLNVLNTANCRISFPTRDGFFFGSVDYGEPYWEDVRQLGTFVDKILAEFDFEKDKIWFYVWF